MSATKKGKTGSKATPSATKTQKGARAGAKKKTSAKVNGTNPSVPKTTTAATKTAVSIKLTAKQRELLGKVQATGPNGLIPANKSEEKSLESLNSKKLLKKGKKDKEKGFYAYLLSKIGEKHLAPATS